MSNTTSLRKSDSYPLLKWADERRGPLKHVRDIFSPRPWQPRPVVEPNSPPTVVSLAVAQMMLHEAELLNSARLDQALRAEARATTLQASASIAIGLTLTGAAFLVDPTKVADRPWRIALAVAFLVLLLCLGMAGYLANRATAKMMQYVQPTPKEIRERAVMSDIDASVDRAVQLIGCWDTNRYFSAFKIKNVNVAGLWFRAALIWFAILSALLAVYVLIGPTPHSK